MSFLQNTKENFRTRREVWNQNREQNRIKREAERAEIAGVYRSQYQVFETVGGWAWKVWAEKYDWHGHNEYDVHECWGVFRGDSKYNRASEKIYTTEALAEAAAREVALEIKEEVRLLRQKEITPVKSV